MRLSFGGQNLQRTDDTLEDCGLYDRARIVGYLRLSGGATHYIQGHKIGKNIKITNKEDIITLKMIFQLWSFLVAIQLHQNL